MGDGSLQGMVGLVLSEVKEGGRKNRSQGGKTGGRSEEKERKLTIGSVHF